jgi:hypothetical protein
MMMKRTLFAGAFLALVAAAPLAAQQQPMTRFSVEPYVGYNFFGSLPGEAVRLESTVALGGRAAYQMSPQWAVFGNFQRSNPEVTVATATGAPLRVDENVQVDQWAVGAEFSYVPRGGAEGMLPIILEAGLGQTRYAWDGPAVSDFGVKLGVSSAIQLSRNLAVRYGVDDYISNYGGEHGVVNQFTARVGAELRF